MQFIVPLPRVASHGGSVHGMGSSCSRGGKLRSPQSIEMGNPIIDEGLGLGAPALGGGMFPSRRLHRLNT
jgi:hypothetical protein